MAWLRIYEPGDRACQKRDARSKLMYWGMQRLRSRLARHFACGSDLRAWFSAFVVLYQRERSVCSLLELLLTSRLLGPIEGGLSRPDASLTSPSGSSVNSPRCCRISSTHDLVI